MQQRRGTAAQWTSVNPVLASGEIGFESDTNKFKIGNGVAVWSALSYAAPDVSSYATQAYVNSAISNVIDAAPAALDTLNELAAALNDDSNFATTITNQLNNHTHDTADITDFSITSPTAGQVLTYNGTEWQNQDNPEPLSPFLLMGA